MTALLEEIAIIDSGSGFPNEYQGISAGDMPFAKVSDISRAVAAGGRHIGMAQNYISLETAQVLKTKPFPAGSIVFAKIGEAIRKNNRAITTREMIFDNNVMGVMPDLTRVDRDYLYFFLRTLDFYTLANKTSVPALRKSDLARLPIPLPPLETQRQLATVLDIADTIRTKRRSALKKVDQLFQSIFLQTFGELEIDGQWPVKTISELTTETKLGLVRAAEEVGPDLDVPYIRMNAIGRDGALDLSNVLKTKASPEECEQYALKRGDFLFNTRNSRELVGKTAVFRGNSLHIFNNNILRMRFSDEVHPEYVAAAFKSKMIQRALDARKAGTTSVFAIYWKSLATIPVPVPPVTLQQRFANQVEKLEAIKIRYSSSLTTLDALFESLQHRAFHRST